MYSSHSLSLRCPSPFAPFGPLYREEALLFIPRDTRADEEEVGRDGEDGEEGEGEEGIREVTTRQASLFRLLLALFSSPSPPSSLPSSLSSPPSSYPPSCREEGGGEGRGEGGGGGMGGSTTE